jgi:hypothetical protein
LAQLPISHELKSAHLKSVHVLLRFGLRTIILVVFAAFGSIGFGGSLIALLWMSTLLSAAIGTIRHERPFDAVLNHWDEAIFYLALCSLVSGLHQAVPV